MADPKFEAHQLALAAAQGVAIALSHRPQPQQTKQEFVLPPRIICGLPKYLFEAVLQANNEGTVIVKSLTAQNAP
jgi:hypothetical protein